VSPIRLTIVTQVHERLPAPVHRNVGKQAMFDLVPLARAGREMTDRDGQPQAIRELLQFPFPQTHAGTIAAPGIGCNQQGGGIWIGAPAHLIPPPANRVHSKTRRIVIDPDVAWRRGQDCANVDFIRRRSS